MGKMASAEFEAHREAKHSIDNSTIPTGLLARLGLGKPTEPMKRRI